jgi:site-specific DNA recombinase
MIVGVYCRLSVLKLSERATEAALERQEADCRAVAERHGWNVARVYPDEGMSAYRGRKRPGFEEALADLESGRIQVLICWKLDRLVRRLKDWVRVEEAVEKSGGRLVSVNDGEPDQLTLRILASMAEQESRNTSIRVRAQRDQAARAGRPQSGGRRTFGFTRDRSAVIEAEAEAIRGAADLILRGRSVREATQWINRTGVRTPTGREWQQVTLRGTLLNAALVKQRTYKGEVVAEGTWAAPPILDRGTWDRLCAILQDPSRLNRPGRPHRWLLSGLATCSICGRVLIAHYRPKSRGGAREYFCMPQPGKPNCGKTSVIAGPLEALVAEQVLQELSDGRLERALAAHGGKVTELTEQREAVRARLRTVRRWWNAGEIEDAEYREHRDELKTNLDDVQERLSRELAKSSLSELPTAEEELRSWWHTKATLDQQRQVLRNVLSSVMVGPGSKRGGPKFQSERIAPPWGIQWRI